MFDKRKLEFTIALVTSCAVTTFAFYQRYRAVNVSVVTFYLAAAVICLLPVLYGLVRRQVCLLRRA